MAIAATIKYLFGKVKHVIKIILLPTQSKM